MNELVATTLRAKDGALDAARLGAARGLEAARAAPSLARDLSSASLEALSRGAVQAKSASALAARSATRYASRNPGRVALAALLFGAVLAVAAYGSARRKASDAAKDGKSNEGKSKDAGIDAVDASRGSAT